jgi:RNA polymerase sigma-54 factor
MARLIDNLDLLARADGGLKRICGVDDEDLADMIRELRAYDPKPGCRFAAEPSRERRARRVRAPHRGGWRSSSTARPCRGCWSTAAIIRS